MRLRPRLPLNERGAALPTALFAVAVLSVLAAAAATLGKGAIRSSAYWPNYTSALYVAESGINDAFYRLDRLQQVTRATYPGDEPSFTNGAGLVDDQSSYKVWIEDLGGMLVLATSRGTRAGVNRVVQVQIRLPRSCLFWDPEPPPDGDGIIEMSKNPPRMCDIDVVVDVPDPPPGTGPGGKLELKKKETRILGPGTYAYTDVKLEEDTALTINGPATIYVSGDFEIGKDANLTLNGQVTFYLKEHLDVKESASVQVNGTADFYSGEGVSFGQQSSLSGTGATTFYVNEKFTLDNRAQVGSDPTLVTVFMSTTSEPTVELKNNSVFNGGIYAPTAEVTLKKDVQLTGAVVGDTVELKSGVDVTYDPEVSSGGPGSTAIVGGTWGEM